MATLFGFVISLLIGAAAGLSVGFLLKPFNRRRWMKKAMLRHGAFIDHCPKCLRRTPVYADGQCRCLYCNTLIGKAKKIKSRGFKIGRDGRPTWSFDLPDLRPNESAEGGGNLMG